MAQSELWVSGGSWQEPSKPYRSWPFSRTRLERAAFALDIDDDELRELLRDAIQAKLRTRGEAWDKLDTSLQKRENGRRRSA